MAGCSHMRSFIAGATSTGHVAASAQLVRRLSASPWASLAIVLADAGAIEVGVGVAHELEVAGRVVRGGSWPGKAPRAGSRSNSPVSTGAPVSAAKDAAPTNRCAVGVWITRTAWPAFVARRTSSSALYAAMPPLTPRRRRAMRGPASGSGT